jgi:hypothetical protein
MRNSRRNIPDPISPQNPLHQTDRTPDRIQDHLEDKVPMEEILKTDENAEEIRLREERLRAEELLRRDSLRRQNDLDSSVDESSL